MRHGPHYIPDSIYCQQQILGYLIRVNPKPNRRISLDWDQRRSLYAGSASA